MGWFDRVRNASAGQRVTRADKQHASDAFAALTALQADRERLMRDGLPGVATIVAIRPHVATTTLGTWHELVLDVQLPDQDSYRATRRVAVELSTTPHITVGAEVPVRVDAHDQSVVLVVANV